jgi:hypothetical protein
MMMKVIWMILVNVSVVIGMSEVIGVIAVGEEKG